MNTEEVSPFATIVICYGICSIAAGAKDVLNTFINEIETKGIPVKIKTTGCIGLCSMEPLVHVYMEGLPAVTYCYVTPEKARGILFHHIMRRTIIKEWVIPNV
ncbi:(2Fe-2S) ferredoxin domain-containing protein [Thermovenabulum gondwanense]|mgnify:CR=1 FL=1|uniref:Ferredoxin, 2Fe-2S n=1 Tax=Thermovenabulum gondwanense TaxID=520767 RepID=A0A162MZV9_9FIRM|nr:(2Fe-2S) ferredoxin domain-containing protein [Thermovenabulum gondwanense]KYO68613.1 Ferredoxin, 2Fe-2S [Thermovenabulum gondwanense]